LRAPDVAESRDVYLKLQECAFNDPVWEL
jgi:hypothetical protein